MYLVDKNTLGAMLVQTSFNQNSCPWYALKSRLKSKMNKNSYTFKESFSRYLDFICLNMSSHGGNWAMKPKSAKLKLVLQMMIITFQFLMLAAIIEQFLLYRMQPFERKRFFHNDGTFPNVTLCNHRMFDLAKTKGL